VAYYTLSRLLNVAELAALAWSLLIFAKSRIYGVRKLWPIWAWIAWIAVATVINRTDYILAFRLAGNIFSACTLSYYAIRRNGTRFIKHFCMLLAAEIAIQCLTAVTHVFGRVVDPNGAFENNYFFGIRVEFNRIFIYAVTLCLIYAQRRGVTSKLVFAVAAAGGLYFVLSEDLSMGIGTFAIFVAVVLAAAFIQRNADYRRVMVIALGFSMLFNLTVGSFAYAFDWLFNSLLHESLTLNGRTYLWQSALSQMHGWHWLFGNGYGHDFLFVIVTRNNWRASTAHSQYINSLFCFGLVGLALYINICRLEIREIANKPMNMIKRILLAGFVAKTVMGIATTTYNTLYMYVLYVCIMTYDQSVGRYDRASRNQPEILRNAR